MITRTQRSTLFPYTTLFRSDTREKFGRIFKSMMSKALEKDLTTSQLSMDGKEKLRNYIAKDLFENLDKSITETAKDRKSTRLNSSNQIISYAVFCLKKKKKI